MIGKIIKKILAGERLNVRLINPFKTILVNFRALPFEQAFKLPIFIYNGTRIYKLGKIEIRSEKVFRGMIQIGRTDLKSQGCGKICNNGKMIFHGPVILGGATVIDNLGEIIFQGQTAVGEGTTFIIRTTLTIGEYTSIGFQSFFMDSDDHFTINCSTGSIKRNNQPIAIGRYNWLANRTFVKKGTVTPDYTIVASANTLLSKDYSHIGEYSVLGGVPAHVIGTGVRRLFNRKAEKELREYFMLNPDKEEYILDMTHDQIEEYCTDNALPL